MNSLVIILSCFLLAGCATPRATEMHLLWEGVSVDMNTFGLLVLTVEGVKVAHKVNWCE